MTRTPLASEVESSSHCAEEPWVEGERALTVAMAVATAVTFVWLGGMVLAISFLEAPLKFRAPDVTLRIGSGSVASCSGH